MVSLSSKPIRALLVVAMPIAFSMNLAGCYSTVRTTQNVTRNPANYVAATRSPADCLTEANVARLDTVRIATNPAEKTYGAHLITIAQPDYSKATRSTRGKTAQVRMQIDENGDVVANTVRVTGIEDGEFKKELRDVARSFRYFPAVKNGCAVPTWAVAQYTIGDRVLSSPDQF